MINSITQVQHQLKQIFSILIFLGCCTPSLGQFQNKVSVKDSTINLQAGRQYQRSRFFTSLFGKHYRNVWAISVTVPVLNLKTEKGGLTPTGLGGSFQTKTLRLQTKSGEEFVLRSVDKDPSKALSKRLRKSFVGNLLRDQTSVIHPYGYYILPILSEAAGVYHTSPKMVYVPDASELGEFKNEFANTLAMLEERPAGENSTVQGFGKAAEILSSRNAFEKLYHSNKYVVDAKHYLRARLFDIWIGDWSRREDQWRWATEKAGNLTILKAIPRDRDHAFFKFDDGAITWLVSKFLKSFPTFNEQVGLVKKYVVTAKPMDESFLAFLSKQDFITEAEKMQQQLSNEKIEQSLAAWPPPVYEHSSAEIGGNLRSRRDGLNKTAENYYFLLARKVNLITTDEAEKILVTGMQDGGVQVEIIPDKNEPEEFSQLYKKRMFYPTETKHIKLYTLGGNDEIELNNTGLIKIEVQIYPGEGQDRLINTKANARRNKKIKVFYLEDGDKMPTVPGVKLKEEYIPKAYEFSAKGWLLKHRLY